MSRQTRLRLILLERRIHLAQISAAREGKAAGRGHNVAYDCILQTTQRVDAPALYSEFERVVPAIS